MGAFLRPVAAASPQPTQAAERPRPSRGLVIPPHSDLGMATETRVLMAMMTVAHEAAKLAMSVWFTTGVDPDPLAWPTLWLLLAVGLSGVALWVIGRGSMDESAQPRLPARPDGPAACPGRDGVGTPEERCAVRHVVLAVGVGVLVAAVLDRSRRR